jgi:hypothetical protein
MYTLKNMKQNLVNKATELMNNEDFVNVACGSIGAVGIAFQIKFAVKFYKAMIPAIKQDDSKGLKLVHILLCIYMTYVYAHNIGTTIGCCMPVKKHEELSLDGDEDCWSEETGI